MRYLPDDVYAVVERSVPLACVDFVPERMVGDVRQLGLILRESPHGRVWCHLGGRIGRGETIRQALQRHASETLGTTLLLEDDPQPAHVYQWFPRDATPVDVGALRYGDDPRKHAIGLSYLVEMRGDPRPAGEAIGFDWFAPDRLPEPLWPGCEALFERLLAAHSR